MRIIQKIKEQEEKKEVFFSFEYFPPKTEAGVRNLYDRLDRMGQYAPLFVDFTWGAGGSTSDLTLDLCMNSQKYYGLLTQMHLTCTNMPLEKLKGALAKAKEDGLQNILALRGDPPVGQERWTAVEGGFQYAVDLVKYIRQEYGDYFSISVAGYPEGHLEAESYEKDLVYLKEKIDAGADFIITQLFYNIERFKKFVDDCRRIGITCPIIPGIMPIHSYAGFSRMTQFCKTDIPPKITRDLELIKDDEEAVKDYGISLCVEMCKELIASGVPGLHFYTLNLEKSVIGVLEGLGLISDEEVRRDLPWRPSRQSTRIQESVRPIFWHNRPKSYIARTETWDEYPNGRWGSSKSPGFGELLDYHIFSHRFPPSHELRKILGETPSTPQDIHDIFYKFIEGKIAWLPWSEKPLQLESGLIKEELVLMNKNGFLTINSQPRINGALSSDPRVGWGPKGGFIYQKAYVEFFISPERIGDLVNLMKAPQYSSLTYHAVNRKGTESFTNNTTMSPAAVTWGVFPCKEIVQPTVVDPESFVIWKDEAFTLWQVGWANIYEEGSASRALLTEMVESYYLVSVVDNNFVTGDIFAIFRELIGGSA